MSMEALAGCPECSVRRALTPTKVVVARTDAATLEVAVRSAQTVRADSDCEPRQRLMSRTMLLIRR